MRKRVYSALSLILIASFFTFTASGAGKSPSGKNPLKNIRAKAQSGDKVGQRIKQLRQTSKSLDSALKVFEKNGHQPKINEAMSVIGTIDQSGQASYRKVKYVPQQTTITGDGVEVIFITVVDLYNEWQGTVIANFYDANGSPDGQYVADLVITRSDYSASEWTARFELRFESDGVGYLNHRPGMFTDFALGTPVQNQAAPLNLDASQFSTTEQMESYYQVYPEQTLFDILPGGGGGGGDLLPFRNVQVVSRPQVRGGPPLISPWAFYTITGWRPAARDTGLGCTAGAAGCGLGSALFAGAPFAPCFVTTCAGVVAYAAMTNLRVVRR